MALDCTVIVHLSSSVSDLWKSDFGIIISAYKTSFPRKNTAREVKEIKQVLLYWIHHFVFKHSSVVPPNKLFLFFAWKYFIPFPCPNRYFRKYLFATRRTQSSHWFPTELSQNFDRRTQDRFNHRILTFFLPYLHFSWFLSSMFLTHISERTLIYWIRIFL